MIEGKTYSKTKQALKHRLILGGSKGSIGLNKV